MVTPLFTCNVCKDKKVYNSVEANKHREETKHNNWTMIKNGRKNFDRVCRNN